MGFFSKAPLLDPEVAEWQFDCYEWLFRNSGGFSAFAQTSLIQPTNRFFPQRGLAGHALAEALFAQVKEYAGMANWPCRLEAQDDDPNPVVAPTIMVQGAPSSPAGTFAAADDGAIITYNPAALSDPMSLIATLAHELAHYLTGSYRGSARWLG